MSGESVIDVQVFNELKQNVGDDFIGELLDTYFADASKLFAEMKQALTAGDVEKFRRASHSLKSNSANFGALHLAAQARELEMMARAGTLAGATEQVAQAEQSYAHVRAALEKLRQAV